MSDPSPLPDALEVFYDGDCPVCSREARLIARRDRGGRITLTDIAAEDFDADRHGLPMAKFMVEAFRVIYGLLGFHFLVRVSRWPGMSWILNRGYRLFAANRWRLTGRKATLD